MNLNFIPQVFYDVIARIIPGSILLWCSYVNYYGYEKCLNHFKQLMHNKYEANLLLVFVVFLLSYILSIILSGIWVKITKLKYFKNAFVTPIWNRVNNSFEEEVKKTIVSLKDYKGKKSKIPSISFIYDIVRLKMPEIGSRLVKVRAECHMCSVLLVGWILLFGINFFNLKYKSNIEVIISEVAYLVSISSVFFYLRYLEKRFKKGLCNYWVLFVLSKNSEI